MITQVQAKKHQAAIDLLRRGQCAGGALTHDQRLQVLEDYLPGALDVALAKTFLTPPAMACELAVYANFWHGATVLDLCAGIGTLLYCTSLGWRSHVRDDLTLFCVEINPALVEVGRQILPGATWLCGDIFDQRNWDRWRAAHPALNNVDLFISNPPFGGGLNGGCNWLTYHGETALMAAEVGVRIAKHGGFMILPQSLCPFKLSGQKCFEQVPLIRMIQQARKFHEAFPWLNFDPTSTDTTVGGGFRFTGATVEFVNVAYDAETRLDEFGLPEPRQLTLW